MIKEGGGKTERRKDHVKVIEFLCSYTSVTISKNQHTVLYHHHKAPSCYSFIATPTSSTLRSLTTVKQ